MNRDKGDDRLSLRLGVLRARVVKKAESLGKTPSQYIRGLIAADLGLDEPEMPEGRPITSAEASRMAKAAWAKKKKTKKRKQ
jgi:hypothetical protein